MEKKIFDYIQNIANKKGEKITTDTNLFDSFILDSMEIISLIGFLQKEFNIEFSPEDLNFENFQTVNTIIDWTKKSK